MFVAVTSSGRRVSLISPAPTFSPIPSPPYFCPACLKPVILKKGTKRRWHFAHHRKSACPYHHPESEEHLNGKALLYQWLLHQGYKPDVERFLPMIKRKADLLVEKSGQSIAIEYQCASITEEEMIARTLDYRSIGIHPLWLLSSSRLRLRSPRHYQIHGFEWVSLRERPKDTRYAFSYFSSRDQSFSFLFPRAMTSQTRILADHYTLPSSQLSFHELITFPDTIDGPSLSVSQWLRVKKQWRFGKNQWRAFHDPRRLGPLFEKLRAGLPFFPAEAGWPHLGMEVISVPAYLWQSWLLLVFLPSLSPSHSFTSQEAAIAVTKSGLLSKSTCFPLLDEPLTQTLKHYLSLLSLMGVVEKTNRGWKKKRGVRIPLSLEAGFAKDKYWGRRIL
ncbi:Competence protein CoiA-like family, contains a predicted nuclease domain [Alteribacillus iranensis]|uniref:Competence protein CoiA-like family, contains a predicted nuclease domain n=2 Tax=Alteribacillus iranensis TaxID=930128 RepID=A0A1I2CZJ0_9BACI|nr:Competence protein CoiA-like family, contains a predicted nuclease domain [Alteribacillus iranensis]